ncbi:unnamed protein product [Prunus armeniaca]
MVLELHQGADNQGSRSLLTCSNKITWQYWGLIENGITKLVESIVLIDAQTKVLDDQKLEDLKAKNYTFHAIDSAILETILEKDIAKEIWDSMKKEISRHDKGQTCTTSSSSQRVIEKILCSMISEFDYVVPLVEKHPLGEAEDVVDFEEEEEEKETKMNYAEIEEDMLLMAYIEKKEINSGDTWYLDSDCSNHMSGNKLLFCYLDETFREDVKLGNNTSMCVIGKGNIKVLMNNSMRTITGVFYVPALKSLIAQVKKTGNWMFPLHTHTNKICHKSIVQDPTWLWNYQHGHLNFNGPKTLQQKKIVKGLPQIQSKVCEDCIIDKKHRDSFPKDSTWRATQPLQLVHSNICGPISPTSNSNKRFKAQVGKETGQFIKVFRTDPGDANDESKTEEEEQSPGEVCQMLHQMSQLKLNPQFEPTVFNDPVKNLKWRKAMDAEIEAIKNNDTWELTNLPEGGKTIGVKWIYKTKLNKKAEVDKFKAWLVAKGYTQEYGVDYAEVFTPVAKHDTILLVVSLIAQNSWPIYQLDVKSTFLNGELNEEVFVDQPSDAYFSKEASKNLHMRMHCMSNLERSRKDALLVGIEVVQSLAGIFIGQRKYAQEILERFQMNDCNFVQNPIVPNCKLTRDEGLDMMFVVSLISRFMEALTELHLQATKRVF